MLCRSLAQVSFLILNFSMIFVSSSLKDSPLWVVNLRSVLFFPARRQQCAKAEVTEGEKIYLLQLEVVEYVSDGTFPSVPNCSHQMTELINIRSTLVFNPICDVEFVNIFHRQYTSCLVPHPLASLEQIEKMFNFINIF